MPLAQGLQAQIGNRNVPTVINSGFFETLFLDGRANSLEEQALGPFTNPIEHGLEAIKALLIPSKQTQTILPNLSVCLL